MDRPNDFAVLHRDGSLAARGKLCVMGDEDKGGARSSMERKNQIHDLRSCLAVEIPGWFVREQNLWLRGKGAGKRDALLLAAGKLARNVMMAGGKTDFGKRRFCTRVRVLPVEEFERQCHILDRCHGWDEMKGLKHDADCLASYFREPVLTQASEVMAGNHNLACRSSLQTGHNH